ncbi:hypothetical protein ACTG10_23540 [Aeromonas hydrophila]|uniref:hypothetical protein n=1 Tax=Aeromonas hydrophila TaxID=644 RepID=UPI003F7A6B17
MAFSPTQDGLNVGSGNRCGHNPNQPKFLVQPHAQKVPKFIVRARELVELYYSRLKELTALDTLNPRRKKRSERREATIQVLKALIKYLDLVTLTVGIPTKDGQVGLTLLRLHKETSISWSRFKRAIADLREAGFLTISQPRMTNSAGQVRGLVGIKAISPACSRRLGSISGCAENVTGHRNASEPKPTRPVWPSAVSTSALNLCDPQWLQATICRQPKVLASLPAGRSSRQAQLPASRSLNHPRHNSHPITQPLRWALLLALH